MQGARPAAHLEGDGVHQRAALAQGQFEVSALRAHGPGGKHLGVPQQKHRGWVAHAEGLQHFDLVDELQGDVREMQLRVIGGFRHQRTALQLLFHRGGKLGGQGLGVRLPERQARRLLVAAKAGEQLAAFAEGGKQVHPAGAAGAANAIVAVPAQDHGGIAVALGQTARHQAHHAALPALAHDHDGPAGAEIHGLHLLVGLLQEAALDVAAAGVEAVGLLGQLRGLQRIGGGHQLHGDAGGVHAPAGVDPGGQLKGRLGAADLLARRDARNAEQRPQPRTPGHLHAAQAQGRQGAVFLQQRHHVRDGGQGAQLQGGQDFFPRQGTGQLVGHPRPAQIGAARAPAGVQQGVGGGQGVRRGVVIGDDDRHAQLLGQGHLGYGGDAAVHGDQQPIAFRQAAHGGFV